jgi:hypothetical protein
LVGVLLACFAGPKTAGNVRRPIDAELRSTGAVVLDTTVLKVNAKHKASVHDPRRVVLGTVIPGLTWGLFGLLAGGWVSALIWAVVGAVGGYFYTYYSVHHATKAELTHIGTRLPANSSVLLIFAETTDPSGLLKATAAQQPSVASVAAVGSDMSVRVFAGAEYPIEVPHRSDASTLPADRAALLSMIMLRYPGADTAKGIAKRVVHSKAADAPQIDVVLKTDANGHRHVTDPKLGTAATSMSSMISWAVFGVVCGAISGITNGGVLKSGIVTGIIWGLFGIFSGAVYGFWAGRDISARRLKGIGRLLAAGTSMLLAWADGPVSRQAIDALTTSESQSIVLSFNPIEGGAVLESV